MQAELPLGAWGQSPQKLKYYCILCDSKNIFMNTKLFFYIFTTCLKTVKLQKLLTSKKTNVKKLSGTEGNTVEVGNS